MMRNLLIFCCFLTFAVFTSCKENKPAETKVSKSEIPPQEENRNEEDVNTILFFGNSLTAGMGLEPSKAFPAIIQHKLDSLNLPYKVVNAGLSGETTASGKNRLGWVLDQDVDIFVLELGANDGLRGLPVKETKQNLQDIIDRVKAENPETKIVLAGMQIPPNLGYEYTDDFKAIYPDLAKKNNIVLIPFLLEGVAGNPKLNQDDGIHPTAEGQQIVAENVWEVLEPMLKKETQL